MAGDRVTVISADPVPEATPATIRAMVDMLAPKHEPRPVAIRARAVRPWTGTSKGGVPINVVPTVSALAVREALRAHTPGEWTVILTDRDADDLGAGILAHLLATKVYRVDPWESTQQAFRATQSAASFVSMAKARDVAVGLMRTVPQAGWPPAPGGVLTREHALDSVIAARLDIAPDKRDMLALLRWSLRPDAAELLAGLRRDAGDVLTDACLDRLAEAAGAAQAAVRPLLDGDRPGDLASIGLVVQLLTSDELSGDERQAAAICLARGERWWSGRLRSSDPAVRALGDATFRSLDDLKEEERQDTQVRAIADRADALLAEVEGRQLAGHSRVLPSGRRLRADDLGVALAASGDGDLTGVEAAWARLVQHRLAEREEGEYAALQAAVRLARWLHAGQLEWAATDEDGDALAELARAQVDDAAWADAAINVAAVGVGTDVPARGIEHVVRRAMAQREIQAAAFSRVLARATAADVGAADGQVGSAGQGVVLIERLLDRVLSPLVTAGDSVLLVLLDGLSTAAGTTVASDAIGRGWEEIASPGAPRRRLASLAALPTLTEVSRASLFAGELTRGTRDSEAATFAGYVDRRLKRRGVLFHKATVDATRSGFALSRDVSAAIDDVNDTPVVAVVLNTIDDALDRSDPAGTTWTADAVKHLEPVLARAREAGRTVIITGDHGHIVERRAGHQRHRDLADSGRSRAVGGALDESEEVVIEGRRVVTDDHRAVLAVSEQLRYGPLKAGYHGGAHPAEVVVPVIVLRRAADVDEQSALPPQEPRWWLGPVETASSLSQQPERAVTPSRRRPSATPSPSLFEIEPAVSPVSSLGAAVVASPAFAQQLALNPRLASGRPLPIAAFIDAAAANRDGRLQATVAAQELGVSLARLRGAQEHVKQLLNADGYAVLRVDSDGSTLVLDVPLLCEQFGVSRER